MTLKLSKSAVKNQSKFKIALAGVVLLVRASSHTPGVGGLNCQSGDIPRCEFDPRRVMCGGNPSMFLSHLFLSLSLSLSLSQINFKN